MTFAPNFLEVSASIHGKKHIISSYEAGYDVLFTSNPTLA